MDGAGVEPTCREERATFVSPARAVPQASAPFHSVSSFRVEVKFFNPLIIECKKASSFEAPVILTEKIVIASSNS